ncbi:MAG: 7 transmembrane receptor, partial [Candidatus Thiodiazotropha sp.]
MPLTYYTLKDESFLQNLKNYLVYYFWPYAIKYAEQIGIFVEDEFVDQEVRYFYLYVLLRTPELSGREQNDGITDILTEVFETLQHEWLNYETKTENFSLQVELSASTYSITAQEVDTLSKGQELSLPTGWISVNIELLGKQVTCSEPKHVPLARKIMMCPYIIIPFEELAYEIKDGVLIIKETGHQFKTSDYLENDDEIFMCLEDYKSFYLKFSTSENNVESSIRSVETKPTNILSFVCVCLSLVCLLITLATYVFFKELHTQPGINTITFCASLLFAQSMYQFGAGQSSLSSWACSLIGAICHFLWLSVMFSMNVCSIQIYLTFIKSRTISPTYTFKQTAVNTTYIILASFLFVGINIIVSLIRSEGHEIGYGGIVCYLSTALMQGLTFLLPAAIVLSSNIVFFGIVVYKITKTGQATS